MTILLGYVEIMEKTYNIFCIIIVGILAQNFVKQFYDILIYKKTIQVLSYMLLDARNYFVDRKLKCIQFLFISKNKKNTIYHHLIHLFIIRKISQT